jgi:hypothetical protein
MHTENRLRLLATDRSRRVHHAMAPTTGGPTTNCIGLASEGSLIHLLELRTRYRHEEGLMRNNLTALQAALEDRSRRLWHHLASGEASPANLRTRCDELVEQVETAERDLADVRMAIEGVGEEIAALLAARLAR